MPEGLWLVGVQGWTAARHRKGAGDSAKEKLQKGGQDSKCVRRKPGRQQEGARRPLAASNGSDVR